MKMRPEELAASKHARAEAEVSLACEGIYLTDAERQMFDRFEAQDLSHEERRRQLAAHWDSVLAKVPAAE